MSILDALFAPKCFACRRKVPKGTSLNKHVQVADRSWKRVCTPCFKKMGSPGKVKNKKKQSHDRGNRD